MRYLRGSVVISDEADLPLLRTVHHAGHVTIGQLFDSAHPKRHKRTWDTFSWRIRRLVASDFLERSSVAGLKHPVLALGESGELYLQSRERFLVERGSRSRGATRRNQIWHDVELFDIQLALRRAGVVLVWESEPEIRAANDFTTFRYAKDYDAVVTFRSGTKSGKIALEYERTPKWSKEYERICSDLDRETRVNVFLYLAPNLEMHSFLLHTLRNARASVLVGLAAEFSNDPTRAELIHVPSQRRQKLEECLGGPDCPFPNDLALNPIAFALPHRDRS